MAKLLIILAALLLSTSSVQAHGSEKILSQDVDKYILSLSYDPFELSLGSSVPIGFNIAPKSGTGETGLTSVFVRVFPPGSDEPIFSAPVRKSDLGETSILVKFPGGGDYKLSASFRRGSDTLAETDFIISVPPAKKSEPATSNLPISKDGIVFGLGGLIIGYAWALILKRK